MSDVQRIADEIYRDFAAANHDRVEKNPTCEICGKRPSVRITQFGPIKAACVDCLAAERQEFEEYCREEMERAEE